MIRQTTADWSPKQARAAALLAAGRTVRETAAECHAGERTIPTWLGNPTYRASVSELRDRMVAAAAGQLSATAPEAVVELRRLLTDPAATIRLRAASAILDALIKLREHGELAERVTELEARLGERKP